MSNCAVCHKSVKSGVVVHSECMELLQKTQQVENKPLTMDELQDMDGEPVYLAVDHKWYIVSLNYLTPYGARVPCGVDMWGQGTSLSLLVECGLYRRKPNEWISVKKRPPEYDAPVWGWDARCHCAKEVNYINGEFFDVFCEDADITHWMPMPAPPEVE